MKFAGYKQCDDGLWRKAVQFVAQSGGREQLCGAETLVRDSAGRLVRVERGQSARRFLLCAK